MGILSIDLNNTDLDDVNFYEYCPETIIDFRRMAWRNILKQSKAIKNDVSKELMPLAWHPTRYWNWCMSKDKKKGIKPIIIGKN